MIYGTFLRLVFGDVSSEMDASDVSHRCAAAIHQLTWKSISILIDVGQSKFNSTLNLNLGTALLKCMRYQIFHCSFAPKSQMLINNGYEAPCNMARISNAYQEED